MTPQQIDALIKPERVDSEYFRLLARDPEALRARTETDLDIFYNTDGGLGRAERELAALPYDLRRKKVGEYEYLYEIHDRSGNGTSLGAWDSDRQEQFDTYRATKTAATTRASTRVASQTGLRAVRSTPYQLFRSGVPPCGGGDQTVWVGVTRTSTFWKSLSSV